MVSERILIIGTGSPVAGDELGMQAVELLPQYLAWSAPSLALSWRVRERPGLSLIQEWGREDCVVLIDAMAPAGDVGDVGDAGKTARVQRLQPQQLIARAAPVSSHHVGVAEALAMAQAVDAMPQQLIIFGIDPGASQPTEAWLAPLSEMLSDSLGGQLQFRPIVASELQ